MNGSNRISSTSSKNVLLLLLVKTFTSFLLLSSTTATSPDHNKPSLLPQTQTQTRKIVIGIDGGTESIRACCFDAADGSIIGKSHAVPYVTHRPRPGWAEQSPRDWYDNLGEAVRGALSTLPPSSSSEDEEICAICVDTTCCSVVALSSSHQPLRPSLLWMDARSAPQTRKILLSAKGDPALDVNCNGDGPISAEWMTPKSLWIKENEPEVWEEAEVICEYQDYVNYRLTGVMCGSSCNAAARWHWDGEECVREGDDGSMDDGERYPGRPMSLYRKLGMPELADKLPKKCLPMGAIVGELTSEAAEHLGLKEGIPVAQGGPDAFVGMIGLGCIRPGQLCLITGSSHLHCVVTAKPTTAAGSWGAYRGAPLPGINFAEGGQSSTGSIIRWAKDMFAGPDGDLDYPTLDSEASNVEPGCDGLVALETFQGSRTPVTDPLARGALVGLTLSHGRSHIWRALMEAVCFGTKSCVDGLESAGHGCTEIVVAGGTTRSELWLQMHADVTGKSVVLCENIDAPLLGCAILGSVGAGIHESVEDAVNCMVRTSKRVDPRPEVSEVYRKLHEEVYSKLSSSVRPVVHAISELRGGGGGVDNTIATDQGEQTRRRIEISPSLLASDWANIESEIKRCLNANLPRLHIDIFDGVFLNSPHALTFGPQMVKAMRSVSADTILDIHLCVYKPSRFVDAMADAGSTRLIFQFEAMEENSSIKERINEAMELAKDVLQHGMSCGISLNPETDVRDIFPLLETGLFDMVDLLAVEPGFGGQVFQKSTLDKIKTLRQWLQTHNRKGIKIMVDGGINRDTSKQVKEAGADVLVAGTFLFHHPSSMEDGAKELI